MQECAISIALMMFGLILEKFVQTLKDVLSTPESPDKSALMVNGNGNGNSAIQTTDQNDKTTKKE